MNYKIVISESISKGKSFEPLPLNFYEVYKHIDKYIFNLKELVSDPVTNRAISTLTYEELKSIPNIERNLLEMYNRVVEGLEENEILEVDDLINAVFEDTIEGLHNKIKQEVAIIVEDGKFTADLKLNFNINDLKYKNYSINEAKSMMIRKIIEMEKVVLEEKRKKLKPILRNYMSIRKIFIMDNGEAINHPNVEVW